MIIGIDCTHDTINMKKSVIAYVSSVDPDFSNYFTQVEFVEDIG